MAPNKLILLFIRKKSVLVLFLEREQNKFTWPRKDTQPRTPRALTSQAHWGCFPAATGWAAMFIGLHPGHGRVSSLSHASCRPQLPCPWWDDAVGRTAAMAKRLCARTSTTHATHHLVHPGSVPAPARVYLPRRAAAAVATTSYR